KGPSSYEELSSQQFFLLLRNDFLEAVDVKVPSSDQLQLTLRDSRKAHFQLFNHNIIRRLDNGYEVYMRRIEQINFETLPYGVRTRIIPLKGNPYEKTIMFYD